MHMQRVSGFRMGSVTGLGLQQIQRMLCAKKWYDKPEATSAKEEAQVVLCQLAQRLSILANCALKDKLLLLLQAQCKVLSAKNLR